MEEKILTFQHDESNLRKIFIPSRLLRFISSVTQNVRCESICLCWKANFRYRLHRRFNNVLASNVIFILIKTFGSTGIRRYKK